jgi:hypothetical protein
MTTSRRAAFGISTAALLAVGLVGPATAEEKLVATYGEERTILAFKVPDAAVQKLLPEGWEAAPVPAGPSKDANLIVNFIDWLTVQNPDGKPGETGRIAALVVPARKNGSEAGVPMVVAGLVSAPSFVPGPYGTFALAKVTVDRHIHTDAAGASLGEEAWEFKGDKGESIELQLKYARGVAVRSKTEAMVHSAIKPDFYRIYRIESANDVVRSSATGVDHAQSFAFKASGGQLSQLFDGSEKLISITSLPWYSRQVTLPEQATQ